MLLQVNNLSVKFPERNGELTAVDNVSFQLPEGRILGLAGESGCGKTTTGLSILKMIKEPGKVSGDISVNGQNISDLQGRDLRMFRWKEVSMIFQGAMNSLNPVKNIGNQLIDSILDHTSMKRTEAMKEAARLVEDVHLPKEVLRKFPHQLSGGQKQRVVIAMAISLKPKLIIADEPTTALDVISQERVLILLREIVDRTGATVLFISHDLSVLSKVCDELAIMYLGKIVEKGKTRDVIMNPIHPYTRGLIDSNITVEKRKVKVESIPGYPQPPIDLPVSCRFNDRCPLATEECRRREPEIVERESGHFAYCFNPVR